jgi:hypothetical protein
MAIAFWEVVSQVNAINHVLLIREHGWNPIETRLGSSSAVWNEFPLGDIPAGVLVRS